MVKAGMSASDRTAPKRVRATLETQKKAAELRAAGATFREIGRALSIDPTWARTLVVRALDQSEYESADMMRAQEGARLDRLQRAVWGQALAGNLRAVDSVLKVMKRRAALFGLDHADGLAERQLALAETQGTMLAEGLATLLDQLGLGQDPSARAAAAAMLTGLARAELEGDVLDVEYVEVEDDDEGDDGGGDSR